MANIEKTSPKSKQILLNTQIVADELEDKAWECSSKVSNGTPNLKYFSVFDKDTIPEENTIYFVPKTMVNAFPSDDFSYICCESLDGKAPHISDIKADEVSVIDKVLRIFQKYRDFEIEFNNILINKMSLTDLCKAGEKLFKNPIYVHDRNFTILGMSQWIDGMLEFEKSEATGSLQIPLWLINQFKFDQDYQKTLVQTRASIWGTDQYPHNIRSLYLNLKENSLYYGRCLINEITSSLKPGQFRMIEIFGEYVLEIIIRDQLSNTALYTRYEDIFRKLISNDKSVSINSLSEFLQVRKWEATDEFLCLVFQTQDESLSIRTESAIRNTLLTEFRHSFDFFNNQKLYLIINLTKMEMKTSTVRNILAAVVRDSYMYCGMSNRMEGLSELAIGFSEAETTIEYVKTHPSKWIQVFVDICLDYTLQNINTPFDIQRIIAPQLDILAKHDEEFGTEYYKTLKSYLTNERDITKTAKDLVIHRTTLTHRIEQMKKIIRLELDDEDQRLFLLISFRLREKS